MGARRQYPFPIAPIIPYLERRTNRVAVGGMSASMAASWVEQNLALTDADIADWLGVSKRTVSRWKSTGIPGEMAEFVATIRLREHPTTFWPDYYQAFDEDGRIREAS